MVAQVFVCPLVAEAFHEEIGLRGAVAQDLLVVGQGATHFSVQFRKLDLVNQLPGLHDVREAAEGVVKVLECRSECQVKMRVSYLLSTTSQSPTECFKNS